MPFTEKKTTILILTLLLLLYGFLLVHKIDLTTLDLGRHIKNGEFLLSGNYSVLKTNFYSYTQPDYPLINHHWLSGVIFYLIWKFSGFNGLSVFSVLIGLLTFLLFFLSAGEKSGAAIAGLASLPVIFLLVPRTDIRPEIFTYFFSGVFIYLLEKFKSGAISRHWLFALIPLQIIWVNTHIYFFIGLVIIGLYLLEFWFLNKEKKDACGFLLKIWILAMVSCFINPFGFKGVLTPLTIFSNYGYRLAENQSAMFLERIAGHSGFYALKFVTIILMAGFAALIAKRPAKNIWPLAGLLLVFISGFAAWFAIRNTALFGFFALPVMTSIAVVIFRTGVENHRPFLNVFSAITVSVFFLFFAVSGGRFLNYDQNNFGIGLEPLSGAAADFIKQEKIRGPIFNNYDIGGYLIFNFYPQESVFVDNRPEAYGAGFFQDTYAPMQEDEKRWREENSRFNFNVIFFSYEDLTPWAQKFLINRIDDAAWAPVFTDKKIIIFFKRNDANKRVIEKYEIPRSQFRVARTE